MYKNCVLQQKKTPKITYNSFQKALIQFRILLQILLLVNMNKYSILYSFDIYAKNSAKYPSGLWPSSLAFLGKRILISKKKITISFKTLSWDIKKWKIMVFKMTLAYWPWPHLFSKIIHKRIFILVIYP